MQDKYMTTTEVKEKLKIQQYHFNFLLEKKYLTRIRGKKDGKHCFLIETKSVENWNKKKVLEAYQKNKEKRDSGVSSLNEKCLFSFKGWDDRAIVFCDLVKREYEIDQIMNFMGISETMRPYVVDKVNFLRGE